ncbi:ABC transporter permease, partial [Elstera cyanobacteriorum]|uniref:ABC transporter permease n=1 Tax=Elstera cyanobacteriorum TaxID=2022747 RepID=UPI0023F03B6D
DRVEERNLARSVLYGPDDVGVPKVSAATARLAAWSPEGRVLPVVGDVRYDVGLGVLRRVDAVIGCLEGFRVQGSAQSVGEHTTSAVVQSIFVVIVVDAIAALFCMEMGW